MLAVQRDPIWQEKDHTLQCSIAVGYHLHGSLQCVVYSVYTNY